MHELPRNIEHIIATLAIAYGKKNQKLLQRILVNSEYWVNEGYTYDNWNGGTYGHAVYFQVPNQIFFEIIDKRKEISGEIQEDMNELANVENEHIAEVFLELERNEELESWRENSGVQITSNSIEKAIPENELKRIWEPNCFKLFISHKDNIKSDASVVKSELLYFGVSCFVAHVDIEPTEEWQNEIETALFSMDAFVALLTKDFSDSDWTDQEIGIAVGRRVPIIPVKMGKDPYGFIGKYQALFYKNENINLLAQEIYNLLWKKPHLKNQLSESLVYRFVASASFSQSNSLMKYLERIDCLSSKLLTLLENAVENNSQVRDAYEVKDKLPQLIKKLRDG